MYHTPYNKPFKNDPAHHPPPAPPPLMELPPNYDDPYAVHE